MLMGWLTLVPAPPPPAPPAPLPPPEAEATSRQSAYSRLYSARAEREERLSPMEEEEGRGGSLKGQSGERAEEELASVAPAVEGKPGRRQKLGLGLHALK